MMKYIIRNYGDPTQVTSKEGKPIAIAHDGVIETDDPELVSAASSIPGMHVTTRPGVKVIAPPPKTEELPSSETEGSTEEPVDFESMTVVVLKELAAEKGIELPIRILKADLIELLLAQN